MSYEPPSQRPASTPTQGSGYEAPDYGQHQGGQNWTQPHNQQQSYPPPNQSYYPPQQQPYAQQQPKKKRHWVRNIFLAMAGFIVLIIIISIAANGGSGGKPASSGSVAPANTAPAALQGVKIGAPVRDGKFQFTITSISHAKSVGDTANGFGDTAQGEYMILHVTVTNISSQPQTLDDSSQYVYDASGRKYNTSTNADIDLDSATGSDSVFFNDINPGNTVRGKLAFDMPVGQKAVKAELHDSAFSDGATVNLR